MMFRRLQKQLHDTELGTGSGTTGTRTCTYVQVQWGYTASLLGGMLAQYGNARTSYIFINDSRREIKYRIQRNKVLRRKTSTKKELINSKTHVKPQDNFNNFDSLIKDEESSHTGGVTLYKVMVKNKYTVIPVSQHTHYAYRGYHLAEMSLLEYCCIIEIVPVIHSNHKS
jgi:hypothetical protein